MGANLTGMLL